MVWLHGVYRDTYILSSKRCVYSIMDVSLLTFYWIKRKVSSNLLCSKSSNSTNRTHVIYVISLTSRKLVIFDAFQSLVWFTYCSMSTSSSTPSWINFLSKICLLEFLSGIGISIFINRSEIIKIKKHMGNFRGKNQKTLHLIIPYHMEMTLIYDPYRGAQNHLYTWSWVDKPIVL